MVLNRIREREKSIAIFGSDSDRSFLWIACAMCHQRFHLEPFFAFSFGPCPHIYSVVNTIHLQSVLYFPPFHFTFFCLLFISYVFFCLLFWQITKRSLLTLHLSMRHPICPFYHPRLAKTIPQMISFTLTHSCSILIQAFVGKISI